MPQTTPAAPAFPGEGGGSAPETLTLFLAGDVMTGRGIDQILPRPCDPTLHEPYALSALDYVHLAEAAHGPIPRPVPPEYVWGEALAELERRRPDLRVINLETSITCDGSWEPKGINYRMSPENAAVLQAAGIQLCSLANNHVLDWGPAGLEETLRTLEGLGIARAGAGMDREEAAAPAVLALPGGGRLLFFACGMPDSGIPPHWAAGPGRPGVNLLEGPTETEARRLAGEVARWREPGDLVLLSIHWGGNWGYTVTPEQRRFAHWLIEEGGVALIHGHSSHHPKGMELHRGHLILYGCGDLINDYEGIGGHRAYRSDLGLLYFATLSREDGRLLRLTMTPTRMRRFRLELAQARDARWVQRALQRACAPFGLRVHRHPPGGLILRWPQAEAP